MIHWQNFYHDATCDQLDELIHWADLAASPYALIACIAVTRDRQNFIASKHYPLLFPACSGGS